MRVNERCQSAHNTLEINGAKDKALMSIYAADDVMSMEVMNAKK